MSAEVFDLDAYVAANRKPPFKFHYRGQEWELPGSPQDTDWRVTEAADMGNLEAIQSLFKRGMGAEQWKRFGEIDQPTAAMTELFRRWWDHAGVKPGESPASPDSSESTAGPSTPHSTGTTASDSQQPSTAD